MNTQDQTHISTTDFDDLPQELLESPNRFVITSGDGWELSFFHFDGTDDAIIIGYRNGIRKKGMIDSVDGKEVVKYDDWIPVDLARRYWIFLTQKRDYKRIK